MSVYSAFLKGTEILSTETTLSEFFAPLSEKRFTLKGNNFLPLEANSFLLELTPFQQGTAVHIS